MHIQWSKVFNFCVCPLPGNFILSSFLITPGENNPLAGKGFISILFLKAFLTKTMGTRSCVSRRVLTSLCIYNAAETHWIYKNRERKIIPGGVQLGVVKSKERRLVLLSAWPCHVRISPGVVWVTWRIVGFWMLHIRTSHWATKVM